MIKRRDFLTYFSLSWLASCLPIALASCTPSKANTQAPTDGAIGLTTNDRNKPKPVVNKQADSFTVIGSVTELDRAGFVGLKNIAITRNPANPKELIAVNATCTHRGCTVKWEPTSKKYECPCHGADFAADGKVLSGPAFKPLVTYPAKIVGDRVLAKV
jgi:cytochrome b6-f complex iron-sulfur subunit